MVGKPGGPGWVFCRLCQREVPLDDMAVMAYSLLSCPPCCQRCWEEHLEASRRRAAADGGVAP